MIRTEIFVESDSSNFNCMDRVEDTINKLIKDNDIKKDDIIEYRTRNWCNNMPYGDIWHIEVCITWWYEEKEEEK